MPTPSTSRDFNMYSALSTPFLYAGEAVSNRLSDPRASTLGGLAYAGTAKYFPSLYTLSKKEISGSTAQSLIGGTIIGGGLSIAMPTTTQVYQSLPRDTGVYFKGSEQYISDNKVSTQLQFKTTAGQKGYSIGETTFVDKGGRQFGATKAIGTTYNEKIIGSTIVPENVKGFRGTSISQSTPTTINAGTNIKGVYIPREGFKQIGVGRVTTVSNIPERFANVGLGYKTGEVYRVTGFTKLEGGNKIFSIGTIKAPTPPSGVEFISGSGGVGTTLKTSGETTLKAMSQSSVQSIVKAGVQTTPTTKIPFVGSTAGGLSLINAQRIKTSLATPQTVKEVSVSRQQFAVTSLQASKVGRIYGTQESFVTVNVPRTGSGISVIEVPRTTTITPTIQTPSYPVVPPFSFPFNQQTPPTYFPNYNQGQNIFGKKRKQKVFAQPKKYTPSYEALVFNIRGRQPRGRETGLRIRPIPKGFSFASRRKLL